MIMLKISCHGNIISVRKLELSILKQRLNYLDTDIEHTII